MSQALTPQQPPLGGGNVVFSPEFAGRVKAVVLYVEGMIRGSRSSGRERPRDFYSGHLATTNAAIAAGTATTPTSGTVTFRTWSGTTIGADTGNTATAFNYHDKTIASGSLVFLAWALGAWWIIDVRSCTNLS